MLNREQAPSTCAPADTASWRHTCVSSSRSFIRRLCFVASCRRLPARPSSRVGSSAIRCLHRRAANHARRCTCSSHLVIESWRIADGLPWLQNRLHSGRVLLRLADGGSQELSSSCDVLMMNLAPPTLSRLELLESASTRRCKSCRWVAVGDAGQGRSACARCLYPWPTRAAQAFRCEARPPAPPRLPMSQ